MNSIQVNHWCWAMHNFQTVKLEFMFVCRADDTIADDTIADDTIAPHTIHNV